MNCPSNPSPTLHFSGKVIMANSKVTLQDFTVHLDGKIDTGGQSSVYEAYKGKTKYAAKCFQDKTVKELLHTELLLFQKQINDKNIIKILDYCDWMKGHSAWIFMEYCCFGSLNDYCREYPDRFRSEKMKLDLMLQMSSGLKFLHESNIIHRDIKPSNILLTEGEGNIVVVKISDFGISKDCSGTGTSAMSVVGTVHFCAPEFWPLNEITDKAYSPSVDIFALGLTILATYQGECGALGLMPKVIGLRKSQETLPIGQLMYMRKVDGEPPLPLVTIERNDDNFTKVVKTLTIEATHVNRDERISAEDIYDKLKSLAMDKVIIIPNKRSGHTLLDV